MQTEELKFIMYIPSTADARLSPKGATISFNKTNPDIILSKDAIELMNFDITTQIALLQVEDNPVKWYLCAVQNYGFQLRKSQGSNGLKFRNAYGTLKFLTSMNFPIDATERYYAIINPIPLIIEEVPHWEIIIPKH